MTNKKWSFDDVIEAVGIDEVLTQLKAWMPTDQLQEFVNDCVHDYDLDYDEESEKE